MQKEITKKELDVSDIYDAYDYYMFTPMTEGTNKFEEIRHLSFITVAHELGGTLPKDEEDFYNQYTRETHDRVLDSIHRYSLEFIEKDIYPMLDNWKSYGYALFPRNYEDLKDKFLKEASSIQKASGKVYTKTNKTV